MRLVRSLLYSIITILCLFAFVAKFQYPVIFAAEISPIQLIELANQERTKKGLPPLRHNSALERAAQKKGEDMLKKQYWAHFGPNKETPWQFILSSGYDYKYAGENLAKGFSKTADVHIAWMNSKSHRENIMDSSFQDIGIAVLKGKLNGEEVYLIVQMFGSLKNANTRRAPGFPSIKIFQPQNGDILDEGVFSIRGEGNLLKNNKVTISMNDLILKEVEVKNKIFEYTVENRSTGEYLVEARGIGNNNELLMDSVKINVKSSSGGISKEEILSKLTLTRGALETKLTIKDQNLSEVIFDIKGTKYIASKDSEHWVASIPNDIFISINNLNFSLKFNDNSRRNYAFSAEELKNKLGSVDSKSDIKLVSNIVLERITPKQAFWMLSFLFLLLFVVYIIIIVKRNYFSAFKGEVFAFASFFLLLFMFIYVGKIIV